MEVLSVFFSEKNLEPLGVKQRLENLMR